MKQVRKIYEKAFKEKAVQSETWLRGTIKAFALFYLSANSTEKAPIGAFYI